MEINRTECMLRELERTAAAYLTLPINPSPSPERDAAFRAFNAARANAATWIAQLDAANMADPKPWPFLGSCTSGSLRTGDLIASFRTLLRDVLRDVLKEDDTDGGIIAKADAWLDAADDDGNAPTAVAEDEGDEIVQELIDALNDEAPFGLYFGAHPDDGADFGYWSEEYMDDVERGDELPCPHCWTPEGNRDSYFAVITDHGNVTMYEHRDDHPLGPRWLELWSCV